MRTAFLLVTIGLLGCTLPIDARIVPAAAAKPQPVADPAMVFTDRGQALELQPALRATPRLKPGQAGVQHEVAAADAAAPIGPGQLGVVYNHALRTRGFLTGEIAFKPRGAVLPADLDAAAWPGLRQVTRSGSWVAVGRTPAEFLALFNRLKARTDLEWVQAVVVYGEAMPSAPAPR